MRHPQLNSRGELTHLITTEGLSRALLTRILDATQQLLAQDKPIPSEHPDEVLIRSYQESGAPYLNMQKFAPLKVQSNAPMNTQGHGCAAHLINAGDGCHAEPLRALLDMYTIRQVKKEFSNLTVALVGDILHARVARSNIHALTTLAVAEVRAVGPLTLLPEGLAQLGVRACTTMAEGLKSADVIFTYDPSPACVRSARIPSTREYAKCFGLTQETLAYAKPDCLVITSDMSEAQTLVGHAIQSVVVQMITAASA